MKAFIDSLDRPRLMMIVSLLSFFNGLALVAPGIAFFDGDTGRIIPLMLALIAFYCAGSFFAFRNSKLTRNEYV